jgi:hypothetical protein
MSTAIRCCGAEELFKVLLNNHEFTQAKDLQWLGRIQFQATSVGYIHCNVKNQRQRAGKA